MMRISILMTLLITVFSKSDEADILIQKDYDNNLIVIEKSANTDDKNMKNELILSLIDKTNPLKKYKIEIGHEYYGSLIYGDFKLDFGKTNKLETLILFQCRYGGDGEHTENFLTILKFDGNKLIKISRLNISNTVYDKKNEFLQKISGEFIVTLCNVCDGWEAASPEDIFRIPIEIIFENGNMKKSIILRKKEKEHLIKQFDSQLEKNIKIKLSYGDSTYTNFGQIVRNKLIQLLDGT